MNLREQSIVYFAQQLGYCGGEQIQFIAQQRTPVESYLEENLTQPQMLQIRFLFLKQFLLYRAREAGYLADEQRKILLTNKINAIRNGEEFLYFRSLQSGLVPLPFFFKSLGDLEEKGIFGPEERRILIAVIASLDKKSENRRGQDVSETETMTGTANFPMVQEPRLSESGIAETTMSEIAESSEKSALDLRPKEKLGAYEIVQIIGAGGMGKVYKAYHVKLDRMVAIKVLVHEKGSVEEQERFAAEARLTAKLKHPNIVAVHDVATEKGLDYIVMDFIEGESLDKHIYDGVIPMRKALKIAKDIATAIEYAHQNGIVHRDLKPANIIIEKNTGQAMIVDFGVAKNIHISTQTTQRGVMVGTPRYMAPEQILGEGQGISPATDVYAMGAILYEMLTGISAITGDTPWDLVYKIIHKDVLPLRDHNPRFSPELDALCLRALEKDPSRRYPSARAFAREIDNFLKGKKTRKTEKDSSQRKHLMFLAVLPIVLILAAAIIYWSAQNSKTSRDNKDSRHKHSSETLPGDEKPKKPEHPPVDERPKKPDKLAEQAREDLFRHFKRFLFPGCYVYNPLDTVWLNPKLLEAVGKGLVDQTLSELDRQIGNDPKNADAIFHRGNIRAIKGNIEGSLADFNYALKLNAQWGEAHYNRGVILLRKGAVDKAFADFNQAVRLRPEWPEAYYNRGLTYPPTEIEGAILDFSRALELRPGWFQAQINRCLLYQRKRDYTNALADVDQAIKLEPHNPVGYFNRGYINYWMGDMDKAMADYQQTVAVQSRWFLGYANRGLMYAHNGNNREAIDDFTRSIQLEPRNALLYRYRGAIYFRMEEYEKALGDFSHPLQSGQDADLQPSFAWFGRGVTLIALGEPEKAVQDFAKAVEADPQLQTPVLEISQKYGKKD